MSTRLQFNKGPLFDGGAPRDFTLAAYEPSVYVRETVQRFVPGTRFLTWDGRVFKYAKATGTLQTDYPSGHAWGEHIEFETIGVSQLAGDTQITLTVSASSVGPDANGIIPEDECAGGQIAVFMSGLGDNQSRGVIGNTGLVAAGTSITLYVDAPWDRLFTAGTDSAEVLGNPYGKIIDMHTGSGNTAHISVAGYPNVPATTGQFCWIQTWGPRWVSPSGSATGGATYERDVYFDTTGVSEFTKNTRSDRQRAGYLIDRTTSGTDGAPFIMLQIST